MLFRIRKTTNIRIMVAKMIFAFFSSLPSCRCCFVSKIIYTFSIDDDAKSVLINVYSNLGFEFKFKCVFILILFLFNLFFLPLMFTLVDFYSIPIHSSSIKTMLLLVRLRYTKVFWCKCDVFVATTAKETNLLQFVDRTPNTKKPLISS